MALSRKDCSFQVSFLFVGACNVDIFDLDLFAKVSGFLLALAFLRTDCVAVQETALRTRACVSRSFPLLVLCSWRTHPAKERKIKD